MSETGTSLNTGSGTVNEGTFADAAGKTAFEQVAAYVTNAGVATPVSPATPFPVTDAAAEASLSSAATATGATATAAGTPADAAWTTGSGSLVALLKAVAGALKGTLTASLTGALPAGANALGSVSVSNFPATQPVSSSPGVTVTSTSATIATASSDQQILAANAARKSLTIYVGSAALVNINYGAAASASTLPLGQGSNFGYWRTWGPGDGVPTGAVHAFSATAGAVLIIEEGV